MGNNDHISDVNVKLNIWGILCQLVNAAFQKQHAAKEYIWADTVCFTVCLELQKN